MSLTEPEKPDREELGAQTRLLFVLLGCGLSVLLAVAAGLHPDPHHYGTHQQLGLPPCSFYFLFGVPCPTCGMTTAWSHLLHGEMLTSFRVNAGGAILAILAIIAVPTSLITAVRGRRFAWMPDGSAVLWITLSILAIVLLQWGCRIVEHLY